MIIGIEVCGTALIKNVGIDVPFLGIDLFGVGILGTDEYFGECAIVLPCRSGMGIGLKTCYQLLFGALEVLLRNYTSLYGIGEEFCKMFHRIAILIAHIDA